MIQHPRLGWLVGVVLLLTIVYPVIKYGPELQRVFDPVIDIRAVEVSTAVVEKEGNLVTRLSFRTQSEKYKPCVLSTWSWKWHLNSVAEPAEVRRVRNDEIFRPRTVVAVGPHTSDLLYTDLPNVAYGFTQVEFIGTLVFTGPLSCRLSPPYEVKIGVEIPSATPLPIPQAQPEV